MRGSRTGAADCARTSGGAGPRFTARPAGNRHRSPRRVARTRRRRDEGRPAADADRRLRLRLLPSRRSRSRRIIRPRSTVSQRLAERFVGMAEQAAERGQFDTARSMLERARYVDAGTRQHRRHRSADRTAQFRATQPRRARRRATLRARRRSWPRDSRRSARRRRPTTRGSSFARAATPRDAGSISRWQALRATVAFAPN